MRFKLVEELNHISNIIYKIDAIYIYDDVNDLVYSDDINEEVNNTIPENIIIDKKDVEDILTKIKNCSDIFIIPRPKNNGFIKRNNLTKEDCKEIIDNLTIKDYVKNISSIDNKHYGNNLIIFNIKEMILKDKTLKDTKVYIKIDLDETTETSIVAVSFHN